MVDAGMVPREGSVQLAEDQQARNAFSCQVIEFILSSVIAIAKRLIPVISPIPIGGFNNTQNSKQGIRNLIHQQISKQDTSQPARELLL